MEEKPKAEMKGKKRGRKKKETKELEQFVDADNILPADTISGTSFKTSLSPSGHQSFEGLPTLLGQKNIGVTPSTPSIPNRNIAPATFSAGITGKTTTSPDGTAKIPTEQKPSGLSGVLRSLSNELCPPEIVEWFQSFPEHVVPLMTTTQRRIVFSLFNIESQRFKSS